MRTLIALTLVVAGCLPAPTAADTPSPSVAIATPTEAPTPEPTPSPTPTPEPTPEPTLDPDTSYTLFKTAFQRTALELFKTDVAEALEQDFYWIDSVDRVTYDPKANLIRFDATIDFESIYRDDPTEWRKDTWELFREYSRSVWAPYMEGLGDIDGLANSDWPRWTPSVRLHGNGGRLVVQCPGSFIHAVTERAATQSEYAKDCKSRPDF